MQRSVRKRRLGPQQDAEQHIKLRTDKAGLEEHFIDQFKGRGVFAAKVFTKGEFVLEYRGKLYNQDDVNTKNYSDTEATFLFDLKWDGKCLCLDASVEDKSLGRLVNDDHKMPNCKMRTIVLDGMPHLCPFALSDIAPEEEISYNYGDSDWPWRKQLTTEQYYPDAVEEETFPLDLSSLKTSTTDCSSTEFQVTNEQYYPEAVEEESFPLELTSLKELSSLKTSTRDRSSTAVMNEQYCPEAVEEESFPLELASLKELSSLKTSTTDRSSTEMP